MSNASTSKHLVIVGGGVAGLEMATALGRRWRHRAHRNQQTLHISLVDRDSAHVWKPMLHTIAAGTRDISQQQTPYIAQAHDAGFTYVPGALRGLDRANRTLDLAPVHAEDGRLLVPERRLPYDALVLALGSQANDFGTPGVARHCFSIDSRKQADAFNREVRMRMLRAVSMDIDLPIAIVGGGATGVELAAELVQLKDIAVGYGAAGLASRIHITLIESGSRLLAAFPEDIAEATRARLEGLGVRLILGARVTEATPEGFVLDQDRSVPASLRVWAAGVKAPDLLGSLDGLEAQRSNQLIVRPTLQTTRDDAIFALGDCASLILPGQPRPLPPTAQVAHQQAQHLIRHLPDALFEGKQIPPFAYQDFGALVSLGDYDAYGALGTLGFFKGVTLKGRMAHLSHAMLYRSHQARLHGFWRGSLLWCVDHLNARVKAPARFD